MNGGFAKLRKRLSPATQQGFSLIELLIVILLLSIIMAAIFQQVALVQQRSAAEQTKLDIFQEAREFMDQLQRDLHQAGYPNPRNFSKYRSDGTTAVLTINAAEPRSPYAANFNLAVGLVKVDVGDLWFEGDVDGTGNVSVVQYHLDTSTSNGCPCLRRSAQPKINADPLSQTNPVYQVEVQNVQNGTTASPIFQAFTHTNPGVPVTLPVDFNSDPSTIAAIDSIKVVLSVQSQNRDSKTGEYPIITLVSTTKLNNCSSAISGQYLSCQ